MRKEISGLKIVQLQLCNALHSVAEEFDHYKHGADRSETYAELDDVTQYISASSVSTFSPSTEKRIKCQTHRKAILYELFENV